MTPKPFQRLVNYWRDRRGLAPLEDPPPYGGAAEERVEVSPEFADEDDGYKSRLSPLADGDKFLVETDIGQLALVTERDGDEIGGVLLTTEAGFRNRPGETFHTSLRYARQIGSLREVVAAAERIVAPPAPKPVRYLSTVGVLFGDAFMLYRGLRDAARKYDLKVICGSYSAPVIQFAREEIVDMEFEIIDVLEDPDNYQANGQDLHIWAPGTGYRAIRNGLDHCKRAYDGARFLELHWREGLMPEDVLLSYYGSAEAEPLGLKRLRKFDGDFLILHGYTRHDWKNMGGVVWVVNYHHPAYAYGLPHEKTHTWANLGGLSARTMIEVLLQAHAVVGVQSSWSCAAAVFGKRQVVCSFSEDPSLDFSTFNPRCRHLVRPNKDQLQAVVDELGL